MIFWPHLLCFQLYSAILSKGFWITPLKWIAAVWHCWEFLTGPQFIALLKVIRQPKSDTGQQLPLLRCFFYRGGPLDQPLFQISLRANLFKALNYISSSSCNDGVKPAWCLPPHQKVFTTKDENLEPKITTFKNAYLMKEGSATCRIWQLLSE